MSYRLKLNSSIVIRVEDGVEIPNDPQNRDYAAYLEWLAAGNTPEPAAVPDDRPAVMADFIYKRDIYIGRLTGIALFEGQTDELIKEAATTFRQRLLDIPSDPTVVDAPDVTSLKLAIITLYRAAVAEAKATAPNASATFDKVSK